MSQDKSADNGKPLRRLRIERREAQAKARGWWGPWPPEKPCIDSAVACEHYLTRLESGEQRAGFLAALATNLVAFFEHLQPEHFQRFAAVLLDVAESPKASHRSRLRAVQAAIRPLRRAVAILPKLEQAGDDSLQVHLVSLLRAFFEVLGADEFARLSRVLVELAGPTAKTTSDRVRACEAALTTVTDAMSMLVELRAMERQWVPAVDMNDPEMRRRMEEARRELAEMEAEIDAEIEEERRTGKPVRRDWRGPRVDDADGAQPS